MGAVFFVTHPVGSAAAAAAGVAWVSSVIAGFDVDWIPKLREVVVEFAPRQRTCATLGTSAGPIPAANSVWRFGL